MGPLPLVPKAIMGKNINKFSSMAIQQVKYDLEVQPHRVFSNIVLTNISLILKFISCMSLEYLVANSRIGLITHTHIYIYVCIPLPCYFLAALSDKA